MPLFTERGTATSLGMRQAAFMPRVCSMSPRSRLTFELARLMTSLILVIGRLRSLRVWRPSLTFFTLGMSIAATISTSSLSSSRPSTTSLNWAGVSTTT